MVQQVNWSSVSPSCLCHLHPIFVIVAISPWFWTILWEQSPSRGHAHVVVGGIGSPRYLARSALSSYIANHKARHAASCAVCSKYICGTWGNDYPIAGTIIFITPIFGRRNHVRQTLAPRSCGPPMGSWVVRASLKPSGHRDLEIRTSFILKSVWLSVVRARLWIGALPN